MDAILLIGNVIHKSEREYHGKFGHNIVKINTFLL